MNICFKIHIKILMNSTTSNCYCVIFLQTLYKSFHHVWNETPPSAATGPVQLQQTVQTQVPPIDCTPDHHHILYYIHLTISDLIVWFFLHLLLHSLHHPLFGKHLDLFCFFTIHLFSLNFTPSYHSTAYLICSSHPVTLSHEQLYPLFSLFCHSRTTKS